jgi:zinc protease
MFEGSAHVPEGDFDNHLEAAGGVNNGSTSPDRTNYWVNVPSNALELALWLEADRMGWLLDSVDETKLDNQRDVVKNERRQSYENRPYGLAFETILEAAYPPDHPYHWPVIGSMEDLSAATLEDVSGFFRTYYAPNNASLCISGDVSVSPARDLVEKYFADIPRGPEVPEVEYPDPSFSEDRFLVLEDDVQLPRLHMTWHSPSLFSEGDAEMELLASVLAEGRSSRLYRRLVYEEQVAQDVSAFQNGGEIGGAFYIVATAKPEVDLDVLEAAIREEVESVAANGVREEELERARNRVETGFVGMLERVGGFGGKADLLNRYHFQAGNPGFVRRDLARYKDATLEGLGDVARTHLVGRGGVVLSVVPHGREDLAAEEDKG